MKYHSTNLFAEIWTSRLFSLGAKVYRFLIRSDRTSHLEREVNLGTVGARARACVVVSQCFPLLQTSSTKRVKIGKRRSFSMPGPKGKHPETLKTHWEFPKGNLMTQLARMAKLRLEENKTTAFSSRFAVVLNPKFTMAAQNTHTKTNASKDNNLNKNTGCGAVFFLCTTV